MNLAPRGGALCFSVAAICFVLYPVTRPWADETTASGAVEAMGSPWWLVSHSFAMAGFLLLAFGLLSLSDSFASSRENGRESGSRPARSGRPARWALLTGWGGVAMVLPYYGAETFE